MYDKNLFKAIVFISPQKKLHKCVEYKKRYTRFTCSVGSDREGKDETSLIYSDGIRETTTDLCYRHIDLAVCFLAFVDKIIWIFKDSISISWFWSDLWGSTSRFCSIRSLYLIAPMSVFPLDSEKCLSLTTEKCHTPSYYCFGLTAYIE